MTTHGGKRKGDGRPARDTPRNAVKLRLEPDEAARLKQIAKASVRSVVGQIADWIKRAWSWAKIDTERGGVSTTAIAAILYTTLKDDASAVATIRAELSALALNVATDPGYGVAITSGTVNGQSFAGASTMTNLERLGMLRAFITHVDAGVPPSSRTYAGF